MQTSDYKTYEDLLSLEKRIEGLIKELEIEIEEEKKDGTI